jgi:predicted RNA binding protein YcfA (HicA-like mRNA interferase family)
MPRDIGGAELARRLARVGYFVTRRTGSHIRLTLADPPQHHVTIPAHEALRVGTLAAILQSVGERLHLPRDEILRRLFD